LENADDRIKLKGTMVSSMQSMQSSESLKTTKAQKKYFTEFLFRSAVFLYVTYLYFFDKDRLYMEEGFLDIGFREDAFGKITGILFWAFLIFEMIRRMIPRNRGRDKEFPDIGSSKQFSYHYLPAENYNRDMLRREMRKKDVGALKVLAVWFILGAVVLTLKLTELFSSAEILLIWSVCYLLDVVCILFFCPLQVFLMKNRCCTTCRIFRWDHFLTYTVLTFVPNFYTVTLFAVSLLELAIWEWTRYRYPERFWEGANRNLRCANCVDKICKYKKRLTAKIPAKITSRLPNIEE